MRALAFLWVLSVPFSALADDDLTKCEDAAASCVDDCSLRFGMDTKPATRAKLAKCMGKCKTADQSCRDQYFEAKQTGVDPATLKKDKPNDDLREDGKKKEVVTEEAPARKETAKSAETQAAPATQPQTQTAEKKKDESPPPAEKKKKKKDRAIDEWDPEAL